jgi:serine/threonine protein kinase
MELASGMLSARIAQAPLTLAQSLDVISTCASGLQYLAGKNCPHRDVKPDNILLYEGRYVLGDLGVVKWSDMNPAFTSAGSMTKESMRLGSWFYMAPEQRIKAHDATPASDIYAFGMSWYEMLTDATPDPTQIVAGDFDSPTKDDEANTFITRMLKYKALDRPTIAEVIEFVRAKKGASAES